MPFIPNIEDAPSFDAQAVPDSTDWDVVSRAHAGTNVVSGCAVTAQGAPNMTVAVAAGVIATTGKSVTVGAVASLAIGAASATDRKDIVVVDSAGTVSVIAGTACGTSGWTRSSAGLPPVKAALPAGSVLLAAVYVAATTTSIPAANIIDKRLIANPSSTAGSVAIFADRKVRASTSIVPAATAWANADTALDITLTAATGNWVEVGLAGSYWDNEAVIGFLDVVSVVSGAPVNSWALDGAPSATSFGVPGWMGGSGVLTPISGSVYKKLVAGDISAGTVLLRLRIRCLTAANKTFASSADIPIIFWARNHG